MFNSIMSEISNIITIHSLAIGIIITIITARCVLFYGINSVRLVRIHLRRPAEAGYEWNGKTYISKGRNSYDDMAVKILATAVSSAGLSIGIKLIMLWFA